MICGRCNEEKEFGGHAVNEQKNLCKECWDVWIILQNRHHDENLAFWKGENNIKGKD